MTTQTDIDIRPSEPVNKMVALAEEYRAARIRVASDASHRVDQPTTLADVVRVGDDLMKAVLDGHQGLMLFKQQRFYPIDIWRARSDHGFLDGEKQHLRRLLAAEVLEQNYLPVQVPQYRERYLWSAFGFGNPEDSGGDWREVPEEHADTVQYEYSCLARPVV